MVIFFGFFLRKKINKFSKRVQTSNTIVRYVNKQFYFKCPGLKFFLKESDGNEKRKIKCTYFFLENVFV